MLRYFWTPKNSRNSSFSKIWIASMKRVRHIPSESTSTLKGTKSRLQDLKTWSPIFRGWLFLVGDHLTLSSKHAKRSTCLVKIWWTLWNSNFLASRPQMVNLSNILIHRLNLHSKHLNRKISRPITIWIFQDWIGILALVLLWVQKVKEFTHPLQNKAWAHSKF